jgi:hypothetical protein
MYSEINTDELKSAGQYSLSDVTLVSYQSAAGSSNSKRISIRSLVAEINIYESLNSKCLSGNIVVTDAQNIPNHLPLTGLERVEFKLFTPGTSRAFDFTSETGHPMYVYKISDRIGLNPRTQGYILHFCSREMITNEQVRIQRPFTDSIDSMVLKIVRDELKSKKPLIVEETKGVRKYTTPRIRPFQFIDELSKESESLKYDNAGMCFFESAIGFSFKSYESMLAVSGVSARPVVAKFLSVPANVRDEQGNKNVIRSMQIVESFNINSQFDTLKNLRNGVYNSRVVSHDLYNKTFTETDFDYHTQFEKNFHTEHDGQGNKIDDKVILPVANYDEGKTLSDNPEGTLYFVSTTENIHTGFEQAPQEKILGKRLSQRLSFETMTLSLNCHGFTGLSAGELISFEMPAFEPSGVDNPLDIDPYMSGRYLVKSIRHQVNTAADKHRMVVDCIKDSVMRPYPVETTDTFTNKENLENKINVLQDQLDEQVLQDLGGNKILK